MRISLTERGQSSVTDIDHLLSLAELMDGRTAMFCVLRDSRACMPLLPGAVDDGNIAQLRIS